MFEEVLKTLSDPRAAHAMIVHAPIALTPVACACLIWFAFVRRRSRGPGVAAAILLLASTTGAGLAAGAGEDSIAALRTDSAPLSDDETRAIERHESLGDGAWLWPAACAALAIASLFVPARRRWLSVSVLGLAMLATAGVSARLAWTAHTGGTIVYVHGLGVPGR